MFERWPLKLCLVFGFTLCLTALAGCGGGSYETGKTSSTPTHARAAQTKRGGPPTPKVIRALWVTRWDFKTERDVARIMANARLMGYNTIFFQVRGAGTVYFQSQWEPWAHELSGKDVRLTGRNPGWDPLAVAIREGHRHNLQVHAYLNIMPGWEHPRAAPQESGQIWSTRRQWFLQDARGRPMNPAAWYAFLNPANPEVRSHLIGLVDEMCYRYPVDGVHLDYIRWPGEKGEYGRDPQTQALFRQQTKNWRRSKKEKWDAWRSEQIRLIAAGIYQATKRRRPSAIVSAAVIANPQKAAGDDAQRGWQWRRGVECDLIIPMNYNSSDRIFLSSADFYKREARHVALGMGIRATLSPELMQRRVAQMHQRGIPHIAIFAYDDLHRGHKLTAKGKKSAGIWQ